MNWNQGRDDDSDRRNCAYSTFFRTQSRRNERGDVESQTVEEEFRKCEGYPREQRVKDENGQMVWVPAKEEKADLSWPFQLNPNSNFQDPFGSMFNTLSQLLNDTDDFFSGRHPGGSTFAPPGRREQIPDNRTPSPPDPSNFFTK